MIEEEVDEEFLVADRKAVLTSDEGEPDPEFEKELAQVVQQTALQIALVGIVAEGEEIEVVGIFGDVPREVGLRRGQRAVEVGDRFPLARFSRRPLSGEREHCGSSRVGWSLWRTRCDPRESPAFRGCARL